MTVLRNALSALLVTPALAMAAAAAPEARVTVDARGRLAVPAAAIKAARVKAAENGMICLEFPVIPGWKPLPKDVSEAKRMDSPVTPPRLWVTLRPDGSALVTPTRLAPYPVSAPGKPGTVYRVSGKENRLVLTLLSGGYQKAGGNFAR